MDDSEGGLTEEAQANVYDIPAEHEVLDSTVNVSTVHSRGRPTSLVTSPPLVEAPSESLIYRTSSLPGGMNENQGTNERLHTNSPVHMRLSTPRSRKKAQYLRNSVAVTNSDYLNQWRPHMTQLIHTQSPGGATGLMRAVPSAPSLDTISEHELVARFQPTSTNSVLSPLVTKQQQADPNMFRYTPTPVLDPARQTVPRPLSRPTTPVPPSMASSRATTPAILSPTTTTGNYRPFSLRRENTQAIPFSSDLESQFLPVFINPETGGIYMFEDGYYVPLVPQQIHQMQTMAEDSANAVTKPPVPDKRVKEDNGRLAQPNEQAQRYSRLFQDIPDHLRFVQLLLILFALCCDFAVLLICGLPALFCSRKVKKANRIGDLYQAKMYSEYTLCFAISGIVFHIVLVLIVITVFLVLHFVANSDGRLLARFAFNRKPDIPGTCTEVEVTVRETTRRPSLQLQHVQSPSFEATSTNILQNGRESRETVHSPQNLMIYDPPPPYPGPPTTTVVPSSHYQSRQQPPYHHELRDIVTNESLFAFNRYGQMIPAQQVSTVNRGSSVPPNIPEQVIIEEPMPAATRQPQRTRVVTESRHTHNPTHDHAQRAIRVRTRRTRTQSNQPKDYLLISIILLVFCGVQCNLPALLCTMAGVVYSLKTQQLNSERRYSKARRASKYAVMCNALAVLEYMLLLIGVVVFLLIFFFGSYSSAIY